MNATTTRRPTDKALEYCKSLLRDKQLTADPQFFDRVNAMDEGEYAMYINSVIARCTDDADLCSRTIDWAKPLPWTPKPASDKQLVFIATLVDEKLEGEARDALLAQLDRRDFTGGREGTATKVIDKLMAMPKLRDAMQIDLPQVPGGRYAVENADGVLTFYVVRYRRTSKSNGVKVTICVKAGPNEHEVPFTTAGYTTILQSIVDAGIKDATIRFGLELGCCGVCGRDLTDATSRAAGIGPICAQRF